MEISAPGSSAGQQQLSYVGGSNQQQEISLGITLISISVSAKHFPSSVTFNFLCDLSS